jgi:Obg family GTPase CgtA-like protein
LPAADIDFSKAGLDFDSDDYVVQSDPSYPGQWRIKGKYIEQIARMTHWEYPESVERFGRQLNALGIANSLLERGAEEGDLVMVDKYDFDFNPGLTNPYIPQELLNRDAEGDEQLRSSRLKQGEEEGKEEASWRPFPLGGFLDVDTEELFGFGEVDDWNLLEEEESLESNDGFEFSEDEIWTST